MLTQQELHGIYVPVITPFSQEYELDRPSYHRYLKNLLSYDIQGLVINGTTGEAPTVAWEEVVQVVEETRESLDGRLLPLIIGTGTNDTVSSMKRTELAGHIGADAVLVVTPYYSRPSIDGILQHFRKVAEVGIPVILYEVPSRTGIRLPVDAVRRIMEIPGVIGVKDSTESTELTRSLSQYDTKPVLCGNDVLFHEMLCHGASGGILASANVNTEAFIRVFQLAARGDYSRSEMEFEVLLPYIHKLFEESNPAPLKWLLAQQGLISSDILRLPMGPITEKLKLSLDHAIQQLTNTDFSV
ncbi:4-hydroxy-tetrahydrodipicolinate synthase [Virgibacillus sp. LDC1]|uniref:4-hydroxy-tetrahydrodipicolinate synthase n=1 Tax=Paenibacillus TaxID=44249 RepID=UPI002DC04F2B|nr:4-hydroxy-tetrahydrodipicolinate synthase [Paenibacillus lautus]MCV4231698.1 4-hydroxy-tetrahydrodipicolinate synthase [Virgibacillus sp. LDC1]MEC0256388.1 4-hydroxy-tetrahydrodipicolinate synthase [Paenibacillus lautus]